jgi:hypothetical protein
MARQEPGDLLGQLDHEPVWIEEVEGPGACGVKKLDRVGDSGAVGSDPRSFSRTNGWI